MQLVIVMGVEAYEAQVNALFKEQSVPVFSRMNIEGYNLTQQVYDTGWFGGRDTPAYSVLNFSFMEEATAEGLMGRIRDFNEREQLRNPLRAYRLPVTDWV